MKKISIDSLIESNKIYAAKNASEIRRHIKGQNPKIVVLSCADSRVIPEFIFDKKIGELFVVRIAGNIAIDPSVIASLEYAVGHLDIDILLILGHTGCGAVRAAEESDDSDNVFLNEIKQSFQRDPENHVKANLLHQLEKLPTRSKIIHDALEKNELTLIGGIYHLEDGRVDFL
ncbi:MAG: carbonic anhydrase [Candidatus Heimdallarchaeota archaeon]|nr:carbonic anhydrase [Candidatus Heimdallarchaeota archaeon]